MRQYRENEFAGSVGALLTQPPVPTEGSKGIYVPIQGERRSSERTPLIQSCPYELSTFNPEGTVALSQGHAYTVNISQGGMLLLMTQAPSQTQVFEVQAPMPDKQERALKLVEVRWISQVPAADEGTMYLVGVKFLFEPSFSGSPTGS
jgi:c-di-GMP-binding flagellar brake protein YcgR